MNKYQGRGANWFQQFALLMDRSLREQKRNVIGIFVPIVIDVIYALILSALYRDLGKDQQGVQDRIGCLFFICLNVAYTSALPAINLFAGEKAVIGRERSSGAYSCSAYYISKYIAELPKLLPRLFFCASVQPPPPSADDDAADDSARAAPGRARRAHARMDYEFYMRPSA